MHARFGLAAAMWLGLGICCQAATFRVEVAYFDPDGGPLTVDAISTTPLPDGCLGQVLLDIGDDGVEPPRKDGAPGAGDALYERARRGPGSDVGRFRLNGAGLLDAPGCFWVDPGIDGEVPRHRLFVRVWNAPDPLEATAYWDSPLYDVLPGEQQMIFTREALLCHEFNVPQQRLLASAALPLDLGVLGAYPNPFNSAARVRFHLPDAATVQLAMYDTQGRLVMTLVDGPLPAGTHERRFEGAGLPSGLYFASLKTGGQQQAVRKLLLVK